MNTKNQSFEGDEKFNNIIYYDENIDDSKSKYKDSDYLERNTPGAFILCTDLESLRLVRDEILIEVKKDEMIIFNLITTGSKCTQIMEFLKEIKNLKIVLIMFVFIVLI